MVVMKTTDGKIKIDVSHIARLARIPITSEEEKKLAEGFVTTLEVVNELNKLDTTNVEPTHQVTGLNNVFRDDEIDEEQMLTQKKALMNAKSTYNGFFMVDQVLDE